MAFSNFGHHSKLIDTIIDKFITSKCNDTEELTFSSVDKCIFRGMFSSRTANTYVAHTWEHRPSPSPGGLTGFHMITSQGTEHSVLQLTSQTRLETFEEPEFQHICHGYPEPGAPT